MVHKKEEGTYHHIEKLMKEMPGFLSPWKGLPLLLIPEYSEIKHTGSSCEMLPDNWAQQTAFSNHPRNNSTHGHLQMVNTEIRLIMFFATKEIEAPCTQQNTRPGANWAQIMNSLLQNSDLN